jgi:anti-sigma-K factor RskA
MESEAVHDLTAAYALDALDADEAANFEQHLRHCERCRTELGELREVTSSLAYAAPPTAVPTTLRNRVLESARAERSNVIPFPRSRRRTTWALAGVAAVAAAAAVGLGIWAAILNNDLGGERSAHTRVTDAIALVAAPGTAHVPLSGATGSLAVGASGRGVLVISNLGKAPAGRTYEAWVIEGSTPLPAGLFEGGRITIVPLSRPVPRGSTVAVTVERKAGAAKPSGSPILSAQLSQKA